MSSRLCAMGTRPVARSRQAQYCRPMWPARGQSPGPIATLICALLLAPGMGRGAEANGDSKTASDPQVAQVAALIKAVKANDHAAIQALIKAGADPHRPSEMADRTALQLAAEDASAQTLTLLLQLGAQPNLRDHHGDGALTYAVNASSLEKVRILGPLTTDPKLRAAAFRACFRDADGEYTATQAKLIHYFIEELKVDINSSDEDGVTPLMAAAGVQFAETVRQLLKRGANVNARDKRGNSALFHALTKYPVVVVETDAGENAMDLRAACSATLDALLRAKADVTIQNADGETAVMAYLSGSNIVYTDKSAVSVISRLLKAGAARDAVDAMGRTALDYVHDLKGPGSSAPTIAKSTVNQMLKLLSKKQGGG